MFAKVENRVILVSIMSHECVANECVRSGCEQNPVSRSLRRVMRSITWTNVVIGGAEVGVGLASGSVAALTLGVKALLDIVPHASNTATHVAEQHYAKDESEKSKKRVNLSRIMAAITIGAGAIYSGYQAVDYYVNNNQNQINSTALGTGLGSAIINGAFARAVAKRDDDSLAYSNTLRHMKYDTGLAVFSAASIAISPLLPGAQGFAALITAGASGDLAYKTATVGNTTVYEQLAPPVNS